MDHQREKRVSMGRQKIEIKKIEKTSQLQVTFSKRRTGIFKKAGELGVLCGADVGVIVTSPAGKIFAFGKPSADSVIDRYLAGHDAPAGGPAGNEGSRRVQQLCRKYERAVGKLEAEKEREKMAAEGRRGERFWWEESVEGLGLELGELEQYAAALEGLKRNVRKRADEMTVVAAGVSRLNLLERGSSGGGGGGGMVGPFGSRGRCGLDIIDRKPF